MNVTEFCITRADASVTLCVSKELQPLFVAALARKISHVSSLTIELFDCALASFAQLQNLLETSFLGQCKIFKVVHYQELDASVKKQISQYLAAYQGPHKVVLALEDKDAALFKNKKNVYLDLDNLTEQEKKHILAFVADQEDQDLFKQTHTLSYDQYVMLLGYQKVLGRNKELFMQEWYQKIVVPKASLFELSQHFFAGNTKKFFPLWNRLKHEYADMFWLSYWSEQVWRAYYVIKLRKQNKTEEAQFFASRLPFSFLQKDWKTLSLEHLKQAHDILYRSDFAAKNGATSEFLDRFVISFLYNFF